jgi:hypothetical protein
MSSWQCHSHNYGDIISKLTGWRPLMSNSELLQAQVGIQVDKIF